MTRRELGLFALAAMALGALGCIVGGLIDPAGFYRAWLCAFLFWLGLPLCGVTLVLVHDLTGGEWMASARPALNAALVTMPLATLAGIPAFTALSALYSWTHPDPSLGNLFYLNPIAFYIRYGADVLVWNLLAAFALWAPRGRALPIAPELSWISGLGLVVLALSASFAAIDWIMSLEPGFWSSVFPMVIAAGWFDTGLALVLFFVAVGGTNRDHMADIAAILLATTIFWAYLEFVQFLIIWEENLKSEIPWYLVRFYSAWRPAVFLSVALGFFVPFFGLLTAPAKHSRHVVATICGLMLLGRLADRWWLVMPEFHGGPFWLDVAAVMALGGLMLLLFLVGLRAPGIGAATLTLRHV